MLKTCDVGHRVVVRRRVGVGRDGRPVLTDLLGELVEIDPSRLVIRADDGVEHTVPNSEVTAAKRIPPRPVKHSEIAALERTAEAAWPAPTRERLGDWLLRAAEGFSNRANSALPVGDPGLPLDAAIDACDRWYRARGLTPRVTVPLPLRRDVAAALALRGWHAQPVVLVQTAPLSKVTAQGRSGVDLLEAPSADFLRLVTARKQGLPAAAHHVLNEVDEVRFAEAREGGGELAAIARGAVVDGWLHLSVVEVAQWARRRGLAREVSRALAAWAVTRGAVRGVLQVEEHNTAAVSLYARLGFTTHHRYVTYRAPA